MIKIVKMLDKEKTEEDKKYETEKKMSLVKVVHMEIPYKVRKG